MISNPSLQNCLHLKGIVSQNGIHYEHCSATNQVSNLPKVTKKDSYKLLSKQNKK